MSVKALKKDDLIIEGYKALTEKLGHKNSILFIASIRQAKSNPMEDILKHWEGKSADEVLNEVKKWEMKHKS